MLNESILNVNSLVCIYYETVTVLSGQSYFVNVGNLFIFSP